MARFPHTRTHGGRGIEAAPPSMRGSVLALGGRAHEGQRIEGAAETVCRKPPQDTFLAGSFRLEPFVLLRVLLGGAPVKASHPMPPFGRKSRRSPRAATPTSCPSWP